MLVETRQGCEKFVYDWRLDRSKVGDVTAARKMLTTLPPRTRVVSMDGAYDAHAIYELVEGNGAEPIIKARKNAKTQTRDARGRALRWALRHPKRWKGKYNRRPITESVNYSIKRRFGDRLWSRGLRAQRREMAQRIVVYNLTLKNRWDLRVRIPRED